MVWEIISPAAGRVRKVLELLAPMCIFRTALSHISVKWDFLETNFRNYNNCTHPIWNYYNNSILAPFIWSFWGLYHVDEGIGSSEPGCKYLLYAFGLSEFRSGVPIFYILYTVCQPKTANSSRMKKKVSIGSSTFFANFQYFIAKKVLDSILTNTFFSYGL